MTDTFRKLTTAALATSSLAFASCPVKAFASACSLPQTASLTRALNLDARKKLDPREFGRLPVLPANSSLLAAGTALNAVVNLSCLRDPARGPKNFAWLQNLAATQPDGDGSRSFEWKLEKDWDLYRLQTEIEDEPCIELVSPQRRYTLASAFHDPRANEQQHLDSIGFDQVIRTFLIPMMTRPKMVIAIVDTGVDFTHPDLAWNEWTNPHEVAGNGIDDDRDGYVDDVDGFNFASNTNHTGPEGDWPDNKHGTHVAGLAAGRIDNGEGGSGVDGIAKIMSLNVFGPTGYSQSSILENAIRYAADHGADVINMSLGGREYSQTMQAALQYAISKGSFIVAAAGNDGIELCNDPSSFQFVSPAIYASSLDGMISVGSTDTIDGKFSSFSNYSPSFVEISAPGAYSSSGAMLGLLSSVPGGGYGYLAGTSMSAPLVSGSAALVLTWLKAYGYSYSPAEIEGILKNGSRSDMALDLEIQGGRALDLDSLLSYLKSHYPPR